MLTCSKCGAELPDTAKYCLMCGRAVDYTPTRKKRGNGQGTAIKRGRTWTGISAGYSYIVLDEAGKSSRRRVRPSKGGFKTRTEALAWASQNGAQEKAPPAPKLVDLWTGWSTNDMLKLSKNKQIAYKIAWKRLKPIEGCEIDKLTVDDLQDTVNKSCETFYPARDMKSLLSHLYKRAMASNTNKGRVTQNLSEFIVLPQNEETEATPFTADEVTKLWDSFNKGDTFVGYIILMIYTGMMPAELESCRKDMIDLTACEIRGAGAKTKVRRMSVIAFPAAIVPVIEALLDLTPSDKHQKQMQGKLLVYGRKAFYEEFYSALDRAKISNKDHRLTPYSCRHTYGTEAVKMGVHPEIIKKMLRHSTTKMQERYTHLGSADLHKAVNQFKID